MDTLTSHTQPALEHAYSGIKVDGGSRTDCNVVYRGMSGNHHIVTDGTVHYLAERVSAGDEEPIFQFKVSDVYE